MNRDLIRSNKLQITLEDVMSCPGSCEGCLLSSDQRKGRSPSMLSSTYERTLDRFSDYLDNNSFDSLEMIFVIGDHLYLGTDYIKDIYVRAFEKLSSKVINKESSFILSTSIYNRYTNIKSQMLEIKSFEMANFPIQLNAVIDLKNFFLNKSLWEEQMTFIKRAEQETGVQVGISITLSSDLCEYININSSVNDLIKNLKEGGHKEYVVNWLPSLNNFSSTVTNINKIKLFFKDIIDISYLNGIKVDALESINNKKGVFGGIDKFIEKNISQYIYVDSSGNLSPKFEIIGDGAELNETGFSDVYSIFDYSVEDYLKNVFKAVKKNCVKSVTKKPCIDCRFRDICSISGFYIYDNVMSSTTSASELLSDDCPHLGKIAFELNEIHS